MVTRGPGTGRRSTSPSRTGGRGRQSSVTTDAPVTTAAMRRDIAALRRRYGARPVNAVIRRNLVRAFQNRQNTPILTGSLYRSVRVLFGAGGVRVRMNFYGWILNRKRSPTRSGPNRGRRWTGWVGRAVRDGLAKAKQELRTGRQVQ